MRVISSRRNIPTAFDGLNDELQSVITIINTELGIDKPKPETDVAKTLNELVDSVINLLAEYNELQVKHAAALTDFVAVSTTNIVLQNEINKVDAKLDYVAGSMPTSDVDFKNAAQQLFQELNITPIAGLTNPADMIWSFEGTEQALNDSLLAFFTDLAVIKLA